MGSETLPHNDATEEVVSDSTEEFQDHGVELQLNTGSLLYLCAVAALWAWNYLSFLSGVNSDAQNIFSTYESIFRLIGFAASALTCIAIFSCWRIIRSRKAVYFLVVVVALFAPWKSILPLFVTPGTPLVAPIITWVLYGIAFGCLLFLTAPLPNHKSTKSTMFESGLALTAGALIYVLVVTLEKTAGLIVLSVLPYISLLCAFAGSQIKRFIDACATAEVGSVTKRLRVACTMRGSQIAFGVIGGFSVSLGAMISYAQTGSLFFGISIAACIAGPLSICLAATLKSYLLENIQWFLIPLLLSGLLPIVVGNYHITILCACVLVACSATYGQIHTLFENEFSKENPQSAPFDFVCNKGLFYSGLAIGWGIVAVTYALVGYGTVAFNLFIVIVVVVGIFALSFVGRPKFEEETSMSVEITPDKPKLRQEVELAIAQKAELTERQTEIFMYLAKGRNAPYIGDKLFLSYHTVKAHIYRIYQKLDVHSQQDLIDYVEKSVAKELERTRK